MRVALIGAAAGLALFACAPIPAQTQDPAYAPLARAYEELGQKRYDSAIADFLSGIEAAPDRPGPRKDLAYTYLKVGENELARDQFHEAMRLDPKDTQVAMEYAFLCNESKRQAEARRIFDRIRKSGDPVAERAFQNIDGPLAAGIERWKQAIALGADNFNAHFELAVAGRAARRAFACSRALRESLAPGACAARGTGGSRPCVEGPGKAR